MLGETSEYLKILFSLQLILQKELHVVYALSHVCGQDRTLLAGILLKIFLHERLESLLLRTLNDREISMEGTTLNFTNVFWNSGQVGREGLQHLFLSSFSHSVYQSVNTTHFSSVFVVSSSLSFHFHFAVSFFFFFSRWSYYLVSCHHFSKYTYGAVYESHSDKLCSPCTERLYIEDNGEQAVLWGDTVNCVFKHLGVLTPLSTGCYVLCLHQYSCH